ncbi:MAG: ABC transporter ATP-binding protein [Agathobacter sp.]|nr:ABC transporter ATP-binding protein [Agathobacter sp.]
MSDIAIKVNDVSKMYKLYNNPMDRLKESLGLSKQKAYREHYALHHIDIEIKKGENVGIIGTNGAGKSTLLKIITGVLTPTEGNVEVQGRISALLELGAGFNPEYTGVENVYLNGTMMGFTKEEIDARLDEILKFADIGDFVYQPVKSYSSGMFVRLAFAVAINIDPEILIVDEALAVGDVFFQNKCYRKFEEFKQQGKTILFVSHDLGSISRYCDRAILLNKGEKVAEGLPGTIIDKYKKAMVNQLDNNATGVESQTVTADGEVVAGATPEIWRSNYVINPDSQEYGDKIVTFEDFAIMDKNGTYSSNLIKGEPFTIKMKIKANEDVQDPIVAFTIRDLRGTEITGTNTMYEKATIGPLRAGEERIVTFTQNLDIQGGEYLLSLGCTRYEKEAFQVYHRLYDICGITIISDKNTVGFFDMNSKVTVQ